jgi:hypothetical protein
MSLGEVRVPAAEVNGRDFESNFRFDEHGGLFESETKFGVGVSGKW